MKKIKTKDGKVGVQNPTPELYLELLAAVDQDGRVEHGGKRFMLHMKDGRLNTHLPVEVRASYFSWRLPRVHGEKYGIDGATIFVSVDDRLTVTCAQHGPFPVTPTNLLDYGRGCPRCADTSLTIEKAEALVEDARPYTGLSMVPGQTWSGNKAKYRFHCEKCGQETTPMVFYSVANDHRRHSHCPEGGGGTNRIMGPTTRPWFTSCDSIRTCVPVFLRSASRSSFRRGSLCNTPETRGCRRCW